MTAGPSAKRRWLGVAKILLWAVEGVSLGVLVYSMSVLVAESRSVMLEHGVAAEQGQAAKPYFDVLVMTFASRKRLGRMQTIRATYAAYSGTFVNQCAGRNLTFRHFFVVSDPGRAARIEGDVLYVPVMGGYHNIYHKTHFVLTTALDYADFRWIIKSDDDTYLCLAPYMEEALAGLPGGEWKGLYGGQLTQRATFLWSHQVDDNYIHHQYGQNYNNAPRDAARAKYGFPFHQGAAYVLSSDLVRSLTRSAADLALFRNEDSMVGAWMATRARHVVDIPGDGCSCTEPRRYSHSLLHSLLGARPSAQAPFFHRCSAQQLKQCLANAPQC